MSSACNVMPARAQASQIKAAKSSPAWTSGMPGRGSTVNGFTPPFYFAFVVCEGWPYRCGILLVILLKPPGRK